MTVHEYYLVVGVLMPCWKVYQHVFKTSSTFREKVRIDYAERAIGVTWEEFQAFVLRLEEVSASRVGKFKGEDDNGDSDVTDEKEEDMWGIYYDSECCELRAYKWLVDSPSGPIATAPLELDIFRVTHDVDLTEPYVVGIRVLSWGEFGERGERETPMLGVPSTTAAQIVTADRDLIACGLSEARVYQIQDDCSCCS